ncbi:hypothetical protein CVT24_004746 [Panaeolus cyanescens]|uniref:3'-5' exonuclease n=1 Tax=Panaeolus cyanescens TaxID=181874 RepID=A0A409V9T8_9AGAR|nr:hypothetical protein CVT24_004746 [Panaeolus cyanescens]
MSEEPAEKIYPWPIVDKSLPRPAPTEAYSWSRYNPQATIHYLTDHNRANSVLSASVFDGAVLGFDLEWRPNYIKGKPENPVALIQLASDSAIFLLQISGMREFPLVLADILANPSIVKAGVAIQNDAIKLYNDCHVTMCNCVDLSLLARTVDNDRWQGKYSSPLGLGRLVESYEYLLLEKGRITRSNWEASLIPAQIEYACNDAHAAFILHQRFENMKSLLPAPPNPKWFSFNLISGRLCNPDGTDWYPYNPLYKAGPPPPPRIPKELKPTDDVNEPSASLESEPFAAPLQQPSSSGGNQRKLSGHSDFTPRYKLSETSIRNSNREPITSRSPQFWGPQRPRAISHNASRNSPNVGSSSRSQVTDSNPQVISAVNTAASRSSFDTQSKSISRNNRYRHAKKPSAFTRSTAPSDDSNKNMASPNPQLPAHQAEQIDLTKNTSPRSPKARRSYKPRPKQHSDHPVLPN